MKKDFKKIKKNRGAAMLISVVFFLFISLAIISGLVASSVREFKNTNVNLKSKQSYFLAESGAEDAFYRILKNMAIGSSETITLNSNTTTTNITDINGSTKEITSLGDVSSYQRKTSLTLSTSEGVAFNYGMQVGNGGLEMSNTSRINGSVYVNGNISGNNSPVITGSAIAADRTAEIIDQMNDTGTPTHAITFGTATSTQDAAQSFTVATSDVATQVSVYIKKVGNPSNATVRITAGSSGKPATSSLTTGTLSASSVTTSYGWVNIVLSGTTLSTGTTYWLVLDASVNASNYYIWGANDAQYANGLGKVGQYGTTTWNNTSPSGLDAFFKLYLGGVNSTISNVTIGESGVGNASAHTVNDSTIAGNLYCQTGSGNNKSCDTSAGDPAPLNFPISDAQIQAWKDEALLGGTQTGNINLSGDDTLTIGPRKVVGNVNLSNNAILTVSGTLWITGNINISNSAKIKLASSYGSGSGMVISDGTVDTSNSATFSGSGTTGSYMMMLTTSTAAGAININNSAGTVILVAPYGKINFSNTAGAKEAIAKTISMSNSATLTYETGLMNVNFTSGPSGSWSVDGWEEVE